MLSSRICSAPAATASRTSSSVSASTSIGRPLPAARRSSTAGRTPPAARRWLSLTRIPSSRPKRWFRPPPQRTAYFSSARRPGVVLRVSRISAPVPSTASTKRRVSVAIPDRRPRRLSAVRSPVRTARVRPEMRASSVGCSKRSPSCRGRRDGDVRVERPEDGFDRRQAADDARLLEQQPGGTRRVRGDRGLGRHVAAADVLGERDERDALEIELLGYDHRSRTGSCPGRWTTWPASVRILVRTVGPEVGASALRAGERALGDQPRQEMRRSGGGARARPRRGRGPRPARELGECQA